jgi:hypothetical protein
MGFLRPEMSFAEQQRLVESLVRRSLAFTAPVVTRPVSAATVIWRNLQGLLFRDDGPLWYRGTSLHPASQEERVTTRILDRLGARAVVVGHTPRHTGRISVRLDGRVILADTGMLASQYKGRASALVRENGALSTLYPGEGVTPLPTTLPGLGRAIAIADGEIEEVLRTAELVEVEEVGSGSTRPQRIVLSRGDQPCRAIFKTVEVAGDRSLPADRHQHEVAAYRLDRLLELGMVPPTVRRQIGGKSGSLQLWIEDAISELHRRDEGMEPEAGRRFAEQLALATVFDVLIHNTDRDPTNILVTPRDWEVHLIDHSRAFGSSTERPPHLEAAELRFDDRLAGRLEALDSADLRRLLGDLLSDAQIEAVLGRRDRILGDWRAPLRAGSGDPSAAAGSGAALLDARER